MDLRNIRHRAAMASAAACAATAMALALPNPAAAADPTGVWVNRAGDTRIQVSRCGGALCGRVAWLREPRNAKGQPKVDRRNPNPAMRERRLIGLPVLLNMKPAGERRWSGHIYNADDGRTYASTIQLAAADSMKVQGCVLGGVLCRTMSWTRVN